MYTFYWGIIRFILPFVALLILFLNIKTVFHKIKRKTLARFAVESYNDIVELKSAECIIGSGLFCDVRLKNSTVAKQHATLALTEYGFKLTPTSPQNKVYVNDYIVEEDAYLQSGDKIRIGSTVLQIAINPAISTKAKAKADASSKKCRVWSAWLLTLFQILSLFGYVLNDFDNASSLTIVFGGLIALEWLYLLIRGFKSNVEIEISALFLTSVGLCVAASSGIDLLFKQGVFTVVGIVLFSLLCALLSKLEIIEKLQIPVAIFSVLLLIFNIFFGVYINGSKNWISIGPVSFQPSELIKVSLVFISACTLDKLITARSLTAFLSFSFFCFAALAYMRDFGTAAVYFGAMIIILSLRLCDIKIVAGIIGFAAVACVGIIKFIPYISGRFATYLHAWEFASSGGYQQTQTMMATSGGGLFGIGAGSGDLTEVFAADTDLVFGIISEELGLIIALVTVLHFAVLVIYAAICISRTRSIYYAVTSSAAAGMFIIQASLNIFGSLDMLPLTGVTMPFVSVGGSSLLSSWMLLSFIKAGGMYTVALSPKGGSK